MNDWPTAVNTASTTMKVIRHRSEAWERGRLHATRAQDVKTCAAYLPKAIGLILFPSCVSVTTEFPTEGASAPAHSHIKLRMRTIIFEKVGRLWRDRETARQRAVSRERKHKRILPFGNPRRRRFSAIAGRRAQGCDASTADRALNRFLCVLQRDFRNTYSDSLACDGECCHLLLMPRL